MSLISKEYLLTNLAMHKDNRSYGSSGQKWAKRVKGLSKEYGTRDILDYGCGKATLERDLGFKIHNYDPAVPGRVTPPEPHDIIVCTDVMEHVEPEHLDDVLEHIKSLMKVAGFFVISTREAKKTLPDGRNAHLIVKAPYWWEFKLTEYFTILSKDSREDEVILTVSPK